jgi:hypothetical protein
VHCSKHIPLLAKLNKRIHWGTDDMKCKGGDFFGVALARDRAASVSCEVPARAAGRADQGRRELGS